MQVCESPWSKRRCSRNRRLSFTGKT